MSYLGESGGRNNARKRELYADKRKKVMKQYDVVKLKDGREGTILEIFETACIVDIGDSPEEWETISVDKKDIEEIIYRA